MPQAIPIIIAAVIAGGTAFAAGATITAALWIAGGTLVMGLASYLLAPKLKPGDFGSVSTGFGADARNRTTPINAAEVEWRVLYGDVRISGAIIFWEATEDNTYHHVIMAIAAHEIQSIGTIYFDGEPIHSSYLDADGNVVQGKYKDVCRIRKHLGAIDQAADAKLLLEVPYLTSAFRLQGTAYIYFRFKTGIDKFPNGLPNIEMEAQGAKCYDPRTDTTYWTPNTALCIREYMTNAYYGRNADAERINDTYTISEANICDEFVATVAVPSNVIGLDDALDALVLGGDVCPYQTGDRVQLTTSGTLPAGLSPSTNYYVIVLHRITAAADTYTDTVKIRLASTYLNALAGTQIAFGVDGTGSHTVTKNAEPRYTCNGVIFVNRGWRDSVTDLLTSMGGTIQMENGKWVMQAAAWRAPTISYDEGDLRDNIKAQTKHSRDVRFNAIKGSYVSPLNFGSPQPYPAVLSEVYKTEDNNARVFSTLDLAFTTRASTAQRLAAISLRRHRQQVTVDAKLNIVGLVSRCGDVINLSVSRWGFVDETFEIISLGLVSYADDTGAPLFGTNLLLRQTAAEIYEYDPNNEEVAIFPSPLSNLPKAFSVLPPTNLTLTSGDDELFIKADGTVVTRLRISWTASTDAFVRYYEAQIRKSGTMDWQPTSAPGLATQVFVWEVEEGVRYDVQIRAVNGLGIPSIWVQQFDYLIVGKNAPPPTPTAFAIERLSDGTRRFTFDLNPMPADVRAGGGYEIRYYVGTTSDWDAMTPLHAGILVSSPYETNSLAAGMYTFAVKAVDSSGNRSLLPRIITAVLGDPRLRSVLYDQEDAPTWFGTKVDCFVDTDGVLRSTSLETWDDLPDEWDDVPDEWNVIVAQNLTISYTTEVIDLGFDASFTPLVSAITQGTQGFEWKTGTTVDGTVTGSFGAIPPQATGVRYIQIKITINHATEPWMSSLTTVIDAETFVEDFNDVNTATETADWFESIGVGHFKIGSREGEIAVVTKAAIVAIQNVGPGFTWELISKAELVNGFAAAEFRLYDATNTLADAVIDLELKGAKGTV